MLSIGDQYSTMEKYTGEGKNPGDDYYTKTEGTWGGKGAEMLGLVGKVETQDFHNVRAGQDRDGNQVVQVGVNGKHDAGRDLCFSVPKSVSMLREFGEPEIKAAIDRALDKSVDKTMAMVEKNYAQCRTMENGEKSRENTENLVYAKFAHECGRDPDPQRHVHVTVMNETYNAKADKWQAIETQTVYDNQKYIGQYQNSELAAELKEELAAMGIDVGFRTDEKGNFDINIFSREEIEKFSQGQQRINNYIQEHKQELQEKYPNANESQLRQIAELATRPEKDLDIDMIKLREEWKERGASMGITEESVKERLKQSSELQKQAEANRQEPSKNEYDYVRQAHQIHGESKEAWTREDILQTAGKLSLQDGMSMEKLSDAYTELQKDGEIIHLAASIDKQGGETQYYTSKELQKDSDKVLASVDGGRGKGHAPMSMEEAKESIKAFEERQRDAKPDFKFTESQTKAAEMLQTNGDKVAAVQGDWGSGKTSMLKAVTEGIEAKGGTVRGMAYTGAAADEMKIKAGMEASTIHKFIGKAERGELAFRKNETWIVDEASMIGTKQFVKLMDLADANSANIRVIGDTNQLPGMAAGAPFRVLQERGIETTHMHDIVRQKGEYGQIAADLAAKRIDQAFEKMDAAGRVHEIANRDERLAAVKEDYFKGDWKHTKIVTPLNRDRHELNNSIRDELKEKGQIGVDRQGQKGEYEFAIREAKNLTGEEKYFAGREGRGYEKGDIVITNIAGKTGKAGAEGRITDVDSDNHRITVQGKDGKTREINLKENGGDISLYSETKKSFTIGERVVFGKNDDRLHVQNGTTGTLQAVDRDGNMSVRTDGGKIVDFNVRQFGYVEHGYATTAHKAQGKDAIKVIGNIEAQHSSSNTLGVIATRGQQEYSIYTDNKEQLKDNSKEAAEKLAIADFDKKHGQEVHEVGEHVKSEVGKDGHTEHHGAGHEAGKPETSKSEHDTGKDTSRDYSKDSDSSKGHNSHDTGHSQGHEESHEHELGIEM